MAIRQSYQRIADILAAEQAISVGPGEHRTIQNITRSIADVLKLEDEGFDRTSFYEAAGLTPDGFDVAAGYIYSSDRVGV